MSRHRSIVPVAAVALAAGISMAWFRAGPLAAQPNPPNPNPKPTAPELICGSCIIYGVPVPLQPGVPDGVYQINTCTGTVHFTEALVGALNLGVANQTSLFVGDFASNLFVDMIPIVVPPAMVGLTPVGATGMSEGGLGTLFDVDLFGTFTSLSPAARSSWCRHDQR